MDPCQGAVRDGLAGLPGKYGEITPFLCDGTWITLQVTFGGMVIASILAFLVGLAATSRLRTVRGVARTYVEFIRGTSVIVQMVWVFFALPLITGYKLTPMFAGIITIGLSLGAYGSEVVRGGIQAVPVTQREAGIALNLSAFQRLRHIILPQALVGMLPPMNNQYIELLKSTSLVSAITLGDVIFEAKTLINSGSDRLTVMTLVMVIYLVIALLITLCMRLLERRAARMVGRDVPPLIRRPSAPRVSAPAPVGGDA